MLSSHRFMASQADSLFPWESVAQPASSVTMARSKNGFMEIQYAEIGRLEKAKESSGEPG